MNDLTLDYTVPAINTATSVSMDFPGPKSMELLKMQENDESTAITYPKNIPIAIKKAIGSYVEDMDGNIFLDFLTGAGVLCMGHNHPRIIKAALAQMNVLSHSLDFPTPTKQEFKQELMQLLPMGMRENMRIHFSGPTGADAVETAIKIARAHTGRTGIVSFQGSYHGSTHLTMGLTSSAGAKQHQPEIPQGVSFFPFPYCFRCPMGLKESSCETNCLQYLEKTLKDSHGGIAKPAAVIIEPVQGEGGSIPATKTFFSKLQQLLRELDIPLIVDEVQSGIGRSGSWFAFEQFDIEPDIVISSKALSGIGQPLSVVMYNRKFNWAKGAHIGTFRGNQIAMACAVENFRLMKEENILDNVNHLSEWAYQYLLDALKGIDIVGDIRGMGFMMGIEIIDPSSGVACSQRAHEIQKIALHNGLIVELGGRNDGVIRLLPPLNINHADLSEALSILVAAIKDSHCINVAVTPRPLVNQYDVQFLDEEQLHVMPADEFKSSLKSVFDASIPWDDPQYDAHFQDHYFEHAKACVIVRDQGKPIALSLAFSGYCKDLPVLYISGIWVSCDYKSQGLGQLIIETLVECGMKSCFGDTEKIRYVSLRTQNPQIYEYFNHRYDLYPHIDKQPYDNILSVADWVHQRYSPNKEYDKQQMIIRNAFPKGIIVGHLHPAKDNTIDSFINDHLDILDGDSYILVSPYQQI